jgi:hypothetical protein
MYPDSPPGILVAAADAVTAVSTHPLGAALAAALGASPIPATSAITLVTAAGGAGATLDPDAGSICEVSGAVIVTPGRRNAALASAGTLGDAVSDSVASATASAKVSISDFEISVVRSSLTVSESEAGTGVHLSCPARDERDVVFTSFPASSADPLSVSLAASTLLAADHDALLGPVGFSTSVSRSTASDMPATASDGLTALVADNSAVRAAACTAAPSACCFPGALAECVTELTAGSFTDEAAAITGLLTLVAPLGVVVVQSTAAAQVVAAAAAAAAGGDGDDVDESSYLGLPYCPLPSATDAATIGVSVVCADADAGTDAGIPFVSSTAPFSTTSTSSADPASNGHSALTLSSAPALCSALRFAIDRAATQDPAIATLLVANGDWETLSGFYSPAASFTSTEDSNAVPPAIGGLGTSFAPGSVSAAKRDSYIAAAAAYASAHANDDANAVAANLISLSAFISDPALGPSWATSVLVAASIDTSASGYVAATDSPTLTLLLSACDTFPQLHLREAFSAAASDLLPPSIAALTARSGAVALQAGGADISASSAADPASGIYLLSRRYTQFDTPSDVAFGGSFQTAFGTELPQLTAAIVGVEATAGTATFSSTPGDADSDGVLDVGGALFLGTASFASATAGSGVAGLDDALVCVASATTPTIPLAQAAIASAGIGSGVARSNPANAAFTAPESVLLHPSDFAALSAASAAAVLSPTSSISLTAASLDVSAQRTVSTAFLPDGPDALAYVSSVAAAGLRLRTGRALTAATVSESLSASRVAISAVDAPLSAAVGVCVGSDDAAAAASAAGVVVAVTPVSPSASGHGIAVTSVTAPAAYSEFGVILSVGGDFEVSSDTFVDPSDPSHALPVSFSVPGPANSPTSGTMYGPDGLLFTTNVSAAVDTIQATLSIDRSSLGTFGPSGGNVLSLHPPPDVTSRAALLSARLLAGYSGPQATLEANSMTLRSDSVCTQFDAAGVPLVDAATACDSVNELTGVSRAKSADNTSPAAIGKLATRVLDLVAQRPYTASSAAATRMSSALRLRQVSTTSSAAVELQAGGAGGSITVTAKALQSDLAAGALALQVGSAAAATLAVVAAEASFEYGVADAAGTVTGSNPGMSIFSTLGSGVPDATNPSALLFLPSAVSPTAQLSLVAASSCAVLSPADTGSDASARVYSAYTNADGSTVSATVLAALGDLSIVSPSTSLLFSGGEVSLTTADVNSDGDAASGNNCGLLNVGDAGNAGVWLDPVSGAGVGVDYRYVGLTLPDTLTGCLLRASDSSTPSLDFTTTGGGLVAFDLNDSSRLRTPRSSVTLSLGATDGTPDVGAVRVGYDAEQTAAALGHVPSTALLDASAVVLTAGTASIAMGDDADFGAAVAVEGDRVYSTSTGTHPASVSVSAAKVLVASYTDADLAADDLLLMLPIDDAVPLRSSRFSGRVSDAYGVELCQGPETGSPVGYASTVYCNQAGVSVTVPSGSGNTRTGGVVLYGADGIALTLTGGDAATVVISGGTTVIDSNWAVPHSVQQFGDTYLFDNSVWHSSVAADDSDGEWPLHLASAGHVRIRPHVCSPVSSPSSGYSCAVPDVVNGDPEPRIVLRTHSGGNDSQLAVLGNSIFNPDFAGVGNAATHVGLDQLVLRLPATADAAAGYTLHPHLSADVDGTVSGTAAASVVFISDNCISSLASGAADVAQGVGIGLTSTGFTNCSDAGTNDIQLRLANAVPSLDLGGAVSLLPRDSATNYYSHLSPTAGSIFSLTSAGTMSGVGLFGRQGTLAGASAPSPDLPRVEAAGLDFGAPGGYATVTGYSWNPNGAGISVPGSVAYFSLQYSDDPAVHGYAVDAPATTISAPFAIAQSLDDTVVVPAASGTTATELYVHQLDAATPFHAATNPVTTVNISTLCISPTTDFDDINGDPVTPALAAAGVWYRTADTSAHALTYGSIAIDSNIELLTSFSSALDDEDSNLLAANLEDLRIDGLTIGAVDYSTVSIDADFLISSPLRLALGPTADLQFSRLNPFPLIPDGHTLAAHWWTAGGAHRGQYTGGQWLALRHGSEFTLSGTYAGIYFDTCTSDSIPFPFKTYNWEYYQQKVKLVDIPFDYRYSSSGRLVVHGQFANKYDWWQTLYEYYKFYVEVIVTNETTGVETSVYTWLTGSISVGNIGWMTAELSATFPSGMSGHSRAILRVSVYLDSLGIRWPCTHAYVLQRNELDSSNAWYPNNLRDNLPGVASISIFGFDSGVANVGAEYLTLFPHP